MGLKNPLAGLMLALASMCALAYSPDPARLASAVREARVVIYAATDQEVIQPLIDDFEALHPGVRVEYHDMNSNELYQRFVAEAADGGKADVVWSSSMDLQVKLVNDGYAQAHRSAETAALPSWATWKNEAFGTTYEPAALVYNTRAIMQDEVPDTHAALLRLLASQPERFLGRLTTYDPARSGVGMLLHSQDANANPTAFWQLAEALGDSGAILDITSSAMIDRIASGEVLIGYNLLGSYALARALGEPAIGVVWPRDYTLVLSRVAFISRQARHPEAARLWLDHLLSAHGQALLAEKAGLFSVREDTDRTTTASALQNQLGASFRPIPIGSGLLTYLDQAKQKAFLRRWNHAMQSRTP